MCESKNCEHFDSILTFLTVQQPTRSEIKPQTNYGYININISSVFRIVTVIYLLNTNYTLK